MSVEPLPPEGGVRVLRATGEIDAVTAPALYADVAGLVGRADGVVLDLSAVTFFDSAGVRLIDVLARECARHGAGLRVVAPPGTASRHVLELVGMVGGLVCDDLASATAEARAGEVARPPIRPSAGGQGGTLERWS